MRSLPENPIVSEEALLTGMVFNIQRYSTEDGPGIRTTIFLKGCPMSCPWCHNPEGMSPRPELVWYDVRCIAAQDCLKVCPQNALTLTPQGMLIDRDKCDACGLCEEACPAAALEVIGKRRTVDEVVEEALRDKVFYEKSNGGVTLSGGEPGLWFEFAMELMRRLGEEGVHVALDTCGGISSEKFRHLVEKADLILFDLKVMDEEKHAQYTGIELEKVLDNARWLGSTGKPVWVRTPIIPGYTDDEDNIRKIANFIKVNMPNLERYDLLAFNNTCVGKYERLNRIFAMADQPLLSRKEMERLKEVAIAEGLEPVHWSGATRLEKEA